MPTHLQAGDKAPAFTGTDQNGKKISLKDYAGKKLVLYFYPQDETPTCTVQACNLRDNHAALKKAGFEILGVSPDDAARHLKFGKKHSLPFPLIADTEQKLLNTYGVWGEKQLYGRTYMGVHRTTFLIDEKGRIRTVFLRPKNKAHGEEILEAWKQWS